MASANEWSDLRLLIRNKHVQKYLVHQKVEFVFLKLFHAERIWTKPFATRKDDLDGILFFPNFPFSYLVQIELVVPKPIFSTNSLEQS